MPAKVYTDKDADLKHLQNKTLAVLGFGSQGHAHALNLKDSGCKVIIGLYEGSKSIPVAQSKGFEVVSTARSRAPRRRHFRGHSRHQTGQGLRARHRAQSGPGQNAAVFARLFHSFQNHRAARRTSTSSSSRPRGRATSCAASIWKAKACPRSSASTRTRASNSKQIALAWAKGIGATRAGVLQTTFKEETETDLFGEQTVLCGGASALIQAGFETLVEAGYQPEMAYFECLHELKLIVDLMNEAGISGMRFSISETAKWGDVSVGPKIIDASVKKRMKAALKDIQSGKFAKGWINEYNGGYKKYNALLKAGENHPVEKVGQRLRGLDALDEEALRQRRPGRLLSRARLSIVERES